MEADAVEAAAMAGIDAEMEEAMGLTETRVVVHVRGRTEKSHIITKIVICKKPFIFMFSLDLYSYRRS